MFYQLIRNKRDEWYGSAECTVREGEVVYSNPAAAALLEYSLLKTRNGNPLAPKLTDFIQNHADEIDYGQAFRLVPSGLKSSIVPGLKHIQDFDPSWIMPLPSRKGENSWKKTS